MRNLFTIAALAAFIILSGFTTPQENIEFICMKTHKASNTCHFNFKIDGAKYRYVYIGCKYSNNTDEVVAGVKEGTIALSRDWKIECPEPKEKKEDGAVKSF